MDAVNQLTHYTWAEDTWIVKRVLPGEDTPDHEDGEE
jgi:hypothetical protein